LQAAAAVQLAQAAHEAAVVVVLAAIEHRQVQAVEVHPLNLH
jgi:hypothetical protein